MKISIIIPVYFNENNLYPLYDNLSKNVLKLLDCDYELIFVDDGSKDNSYKVLKELSKKDKNITLVKLSKNFGSHSAILAGYNVCTGDCAVSISADLQDPPTIILQMLEKYKKGATVVLAVREDRKEPFTQKVFSGLYYKMMKKFALQNMPQGGFDCSLIDRKVIDVLCKMEEKNTTIMGQILWCGFNTDVIYYTRQERNIGKSRWTLSKKIKLLVDSLIGFSYLPIRLVSVFGSIFFASSLIWGIYIIVNWLLNNITVEGWTTLILINLFSFGTIMMTLGVLGEYIWRSFDASRKRPPFIIEDTQGDNIDIDNGSDNDTGNATGKGSDTDIGNDAGNDAGSSDNEVGIEK